jgi:hypothetical protein
MPQGKGTYGTTRGRPPVKKKPTKNIKKTPRKKPIKKMSMGY